MEEVVKTIAKVLRRDSGKISPDDSLQALGVGSSIVLEILRSSLERKYQKRVTPLTLNMRVREIIDLIEGEQQPVPAVPLSSGFETQSPRTVSFGLGVGIDIEEVDSLPNISDLREHPFYTATFSSEELATAILKPEPKVHLCGIFCAKEALRKSSPALLTLRFSEILTFHEEGRPRVTTSFSNLNNSFRFELSISHTSHYATAVVIALRI